ncbi:arginine--tRNA ligase [bacterium]|nr:arginine--tRNA ligase [bacterium]
MPRELIRKYIRSALKEIGKKQGINLASLPNVEIEFKGKPFADYATNVALKSACIFHHNPMVFASLIKKIIAGNDKRRNFSKIEIAEPGFINFFLSKSFLQKGLSKALKKGKEFSEINIGKGKKVQVEFISANPTGPLTVANSRGGPFGDVLGNILKEAGFDVKKAYYVNDYGGQILALGHSVLGDKESVYKGDYIVELRKIIKGKSVFEVGGKAAKFILRKMIKPTVRKLGIKYDEWFLESRLHKKGKILEVLKILDEKGLLYEKDDALWFKSSRYGDKRDRVVVKSNGARTYLASDIAYHRHKFSQEKFDKVIDIWGADHLDNVPGLQAAMSALGYKGKLEILLLQFVTLFSKGKKMRMSKREGRYVAMDELLDLVGKDVVRFFFLQKSADTHLNFDLDLAKEQSEKNPVYYIQYAIARIYSILRKAKYKTSSSRSEIRNYLLFEREIRDRYNKRSKFKLIEHPSELALLKQLLRLPEIIEDISRSYQVQKLPQYALELATCFHQFYRDCQVLTQNKELRDARLSLILATKIVLEKTLGLMGISAPRRM